MKPELIRTPIGVDLCSGEQTFFVVRSPRIGPVCEPGIHDICVMGRQKYKSVTFDSRVKFFRLGLQGSDQAHANANLGIHPKNKKPWRGQAEVPHVDHFFAEQLNRFFA